MATNPPPKPAEAPVVAAPPPPRPVQSLVVVGQHKPSPKTHAGLKTFLSVAIFTLLGGSILLTFAPVRERLVDWKVAATVWWSTRKTRGTAASPGKKKNRSFNQSAPAWIDLVKSLAAQAVVWVKSLPMFRRSSHTAQTEPVVEPHRPTPAEMLLKKIGAPPSHDVSTARTVKDQQHQPAETSALPPKKEEVVAAAAGSAAPANTPISKQKVQPAANAATGTTESPAKALALPLGSEDTSTQARVNKVLQAPYAPAIITLMSAPAEPSAATAPASAAVATPARPVPSEKPFEATTPAVAEKQAAAGTPALESKTSPEQSKPASKSEESVAA